MRHRCKHWRLDHLVLFSRCNILSSSVLKFRYLFDVNVDDKVFESVPFPQLPLVKQISDVDP